MGSRLVSALRHRRLVVLGAVAMSLTIAGTAGAVGFVLGTANTSNATTTLRGSPSSTNPLLRLQNNGSGAALRLEVDSARPVLSVGNSVRIPNLNADKLDGLNSTDFVKPATDSARVGIRVRNSGSVTTTSTPPTTPSWDLTGGAFIQKAGTTILFFAKAHWSSTTACPGSTPMGGGSVAIYLDGNALAVAGLMTGSGSTNNTSTATFFIPAPAADAGHTITVKVSSTACYDIITGTSSPSTTTFDQLQIDGAVIR